MASLYATGRCLNYAKCHIKFDNCRLQNSPKSRRGQCHGVLDWGPPESWAMPEKPHWPNAHPPSPLKSTGSGMETWRIVHGALYEGERGGSEQDPFQKHMVASAGCFRATVGSTASRTFCPWTVSPPFSYLYTSVLAALDQDTSSGRNIYVGGGVVLFKSPRVRAAGSLRQNHAVLQLVNCNAAVTYL